MKNQVSKKIQKIGDRLFDHFCKEAIKAGYQPSGALENFHYGQVKYVVENLSEIQMMEVISFAVVNWKYLRVIETSKDRLLEEPNFYQMLAVWRYTKWIEIMKNPETIENIKKTDDEFIEKQNNMNLFMEKLGIAHIDIGQVEEKSKERQRKEIEEWVRKCSMDGKKNG